MKRDFSRWEILFVTVVVGAGLALRLQQVWLTYLNPDEGLQALIAFGTWRQTLHGSLEITHPPLLEVLTHVVSRISRTELALRLIPLLAGSLFPVLLYLWLRRVAGWIAGLTVLFLLTLAPHTILLSAQLRSYTLALFFLAASLLVLEEALEGGGWPMMALYSILLLCCIASDYSAAWFVGAAGVYALARLRGGSSAVKATWLAGQVAALGLYGLLFRFQIRKYRGSEIANDAVTSWLRRGFPQAGETLSFPFTSTPRQFDYLLVSAPLIGDLAFAIFAIAVWLLWTGRTKMQRGKARALAVLLVLPFLLGMAGAYTHQFPYADTRHTIVIGVFGAIGIGIFLENLPQPLAVTLLGGMLLAAPFWWGRRDYEDIAEDRNQKQQILQCLDYMRALIPPDALVFTERETLYILAYYTGHTQPLPEPESGRFTELLLGGQWRVAARDYSYATEDQYATALAAFRQQYRISETAPVWVLDGGFKVPSGPPDAEPPFTKAVRVFQAGAH